MSRWTTAVAMVLAGAVACAERASGAELEKLAAAVESYRGGESRAALTQLERLVAQASKSPERAKPMARRLAAILESPKASREARIFVLRQLWLVAGSEQIPMLAKLLADPELAHMARYVLQPMQDPAVDAALREALGRLDGALLVGVVGTLGRRRDAGALAPLAKLLAHKDPAVAAAAGTALAHLPDPAAAHAVADARQAARGELRARLTEAWLLSAHSLRQVGRKEEAGAVFAALLAKDEAPHVRVAALRGRVATLPGDAAVALLVGHIGGDEPALRTSAVSFLAGMRGPVVASAIAELLPRSAPAAQRAIVDALAARGEKAAAPAVAALAKSSAEPSVRLAAAQALGTLGDASHVPMLAGLAASPEAELRAAARESLRLLPGTEADAAILTHVGKAPEAVRIELVRSLRDRRATALAARIAQVAGEDKSPAVRGECFGVLADLAGGEHLGTLVARMLEEPDAGARGAAERAVLAVARRVDDPAARLQPILHAHARATGAPRATALRVLGRLGGAKALAAVRGDLRHREEPVRDAAVRALAEWPDPSAATDLLALAKAAPAPTHRILALRGAIRAATLPSASPYPDRIRILQQALELATRTDEKRLVLAALATVPHPESLKIARACAADPALEAEAEQAARKIQLTLHKPALSASHNPKAIPLAIDGDKETRWKSLVNQSRDAGMWFMLDLRTEMTVEGLRLHGNAKKPADYARQVEVYVSNDPANWGKPVAKTAGRRGVTEIRVPPTRGRFIRLVSTGSAGNNWSIYEIEIDAK